MAYEPTDVVQQALDAAGIDYTLGDVEDGTRQAQVALRAYERCRRQLLRAVHWDFARKEMDLVLIADASGNTANVGRLVPVPWLYEYAYPVDCVKARYIPFNRNQAPPTPSGNITPPDADAPLMTGLTTPPLTGQRIIPSRFLVTNDSNNLPPNPGYDTPGLSPVGRTVILSNVQYAKLIYTSDQLYPSIWDELFWGALVAYIASEIAFPLHTDKKFGLTVRADQIKIAKDKIMQARVTDGNEGWFSSDIKVDWMQARGVGAGNYWNNGFAGWGPGGGLFGSYDSCSFSDGTAY